MADQNQTPQAASSGEQTGMRTPSDPGTLSGQPLRDLGDGSAANVAPSPSGAVRASAQKVGSPSQQSAALGWFLDTTPDEHAVETRTLQLNFGTSSDPKWVDWTIRPVGIDTMRAIRSRAAGSRAVRRTGNVDEYRVNLEVVVAGTADPDIKEATRILHAEGRAPNDPAEVLKQKFQAKPGFIAQIAGEIMTLSGFDEDDVKEAEAVAAAGNS